MKSVLLMAMAAGLLPVAAEASPRSIRKMDAVAIQAVPEAKLCSAYGHYAGLGKTYPSISDEVKRRGATCAEALDLNVSNCSVLDIVAVEPVAPGAVAYTIRNKTPKLKAFRIYQAGIVSSRFTIEPGQTRGYGVRTDPRIAQLSGLRSQLNGDAGAELTECVTTTWR